ncbi:MAG: LamG-like jellyroll fold domain-containing protein [Phycisphaerales bacterium]
MQDSGNNRSESSRSPCARNGMQPVMYHNPQQPWKSLKNLNPFFDRTPDMFKQHLLPALIAATMAFSTASARASLVLYYPFESTGSPASYTDSSGNNVVATVTTPANVGTSAGHAPVSQSTRDITFSGGYLPLGTFIDAVHDGATGPGLTIAFWVKGNPTYVNNDRYIYSESDTVNGNSLYGLRTDNTDKLVFAFRDKNYTTIKTQTSTTIVFDNTWHHVVWTDNGGNAKLYVDGVQDTANFGYTAPAVANLSNFSTSTIAAYPVGTPIYGFSGGVPELDDFAIWNEVLSETLITGLSNGTYSPLTIPEPATLGLLALGGMMMVGRNRR